MRISKSKLDLVLARRCMALTDLRGNLAPNTLVKINNGEELRTKTVGRLAQLTCHPPLKGDSLGMSHHHYKRC